MSRLLIVSDSHGLTHELVRLKEKHFSDVDLMVHCGDSELEKDSVALKDFVVVRGNCDFDNRLSEEIVQTIDGKKIFVTHGHRYNVKSSLINLLYRAKELDADIVCFGHSHLLGAEMIDGVLFVNPGSIRLPRNREEKTYCVIKIEADKITLNVYDINEGIIKELTCEFSME